MPSGGCWGKGDIVVVTVQKLARLSVIAGALMAVLSLPALAQEAQAPKKNNFGPRAGQVQAPAQNSTANLPVPEVISTHGDWKLQCENTPDDQPATGNDSKKQCGMVQTARNEKNPKVGLTLVLVKTRQNDKDLVMMRVMAPIGVFLPTGVALEIDGAAIGRVPFTRCLPQVCIAFAEAQATTIEKMRKGNAANFIIYEAPGLGLPMKISLSGFSAAFEALNKL
jgi:invasion protein IalB